MQEQSVPLKLALLVRQVIDQEVSQRLREQGLEVVTQKMIGEAIPFDLNQAQVLLVELGMHVDKKYLTDLLNQINVPVLLYEGSIQHPGVWDAKLAGRLHRLLDESSATNTSIAENPLVIVICASVGGPKAIGRFFERLSADLPVVFLLVQHMAEEFQGLLAKQLARFTNVRVGVLEKAQELRAGDAWVIPADAQVEVNESRMLKRLNNAWDTVNRPSMDVVLEMVASNYGPNCGAIMFSGIGYDGLLGCEAIAEQGGFVWAQSADSCVASRLPDSVRESGHVEINGSPEELAAALFKRCLNHHQASC